MLASPDALEVEADGAADDDWASEEEVVPAASTALDAPLSPERTLPWRHSTNCASSFEDTSAMTPRPNCATLPVTCRSVSIPTSVPVASAVRRRGHRRRGVALTSGVAAFGLDDDRARVDIRLGDPGRTLVLRGDGADLHLHDPAVLVTLDLLELRARHARGDALHVEQDVPRLLDRDVDVEGVSDLHRHPLHGLLVRGRLPRRGLVQPLDRAPRAPAGRRAYRHPPANPCPSSRPRRRRGPP